MYLTPSPDPSPSKGIMLTNNGGALVLSWDEDFFLPTREWYIIATASDSALYSLEAISY
jgi:hypothetical protein